MRTLRKRLERLEGQANEGYEEAEKFISALYRSWKGAEPDPEAVRAEAKYYMEKNYTDKYGELNLALLKRELDEYRKAS
jgi:hypothetical protein